MEMDHSHHTIFGSLVFCPSCGTLFDPPSDKAGSVIPCKLCGWELPTTEYQKIRVVTKSSNLPSTLRTKLLDQARGRPAEHTQAGEDSNKHNNNLPMVREECPECGNPEMTFSTLQMRSADEGQTIFYRCPKCGHGFSVNS